LRIITDFKGIGNYYYLKYIINNIYFSRQEVAHRGKRASITITHDFASAAGCNINKLGEEYWLDTIHSGCSATSCAPTRSHRSMQEPSVFSIPKTWSVSEAVSNNLPDSNQYEIDLNGCRPIASTLGDSCNGSVDHLETQNHLDSGPVFGELPNINQSSFTEFEGESQVGRYSGQNYNGGLFRGLDSASKLNLNGGCKKLASCDHEARFIPWSNLTPELNFVRPDRHNEDVYNFHSLDVRSVASLNTQTDDSKLSLRRTMCKFPERSLCCSLNLTDINDNSSSKILDSNNPFDERLERLEGWLFTSTSGDIFSLGDGTLNDQKLGVLAKPHLLWTLDSEFNEFVEELQNDVIQSGDCLRKENVTAKKQKKRKLNDVRDDSLFLSDNLSPYEVITWHTL